MIAACIELVLANPTVSLLIIGVLFSLISLTRNKDKLSKPVVVEAFVAYFFLFSIGVSYLYNFIMHVFFAEFTASFIGWANSPFQLEVGFASLGIGVAGFIAFRQDFSFRVATLIPPALFLWGAAGGHIYQIITAHNLAQGNAGVILWTDILLPLFGFTLLLLQWQNPSGRSDISLLKGKRAVPGTTG